MDRSAPLKRILIVGGGTAGWIAALYLSRIARRIGCEVVLVESPAIGTIGVGEATIPTLVDFVRSLGLDEHELMRRCSATYKLGIRFEGWGGEGHSYWHPFGGSGQIGGLDSYHYWLKRLKDRGDGGRYSDYAPQARLAEGGFGPCPTTLRNGSYAYHLDAMAFAQYLKELSTAEGVRHLFGTVGEIVQNAEGDIQSVDIGGDRRLSADLFIDATGFAGLLIEKTLGDPWIDWSSSLLCDRAVAMPLPAEDAKPPFTRSIAARAGWMWRIPLSSRTGTGYVYSSRHASDQEAVDELIGRADLAKRRSADPRLLSMRIGRRTEFWQRNCIAVGLSSGFVEPLESTGIHLIQKAVQLLADHLPRTPVDPPLRHSYNRAMGHAYEEIRDFIILHYLVARREEPFWRDARSVDLPDSLPAFLDLYDVCGLVDRRRCDVFPESSYHFILSGCDRLPARPAARAEAVNVAEIGDILSQRRDQIAALAREAKSHDSMLAQIHRRVL
jgi:tryptophan halogenase